MNDPDGKIRYTEASKWFIHLSNLRRTTLALVFVATGASITVLEGKLLSNSDPDKLIPLAAFNTIIALAGIFQELRLHRYHKRIADYLKFEEETPGPYSVTLQPMNVFSTHAVFLFVLSLLELMWVVVLTNAVQALGFQFSDFKSFVTGADMNFLSFVGSFLASLLAALLIYFLYWLLFKIRFRRKATVECWWLPGWNCSRFVIRNLPTTINLFALKYRGWLRRQISPKVGSSVASFVDDNLGLDERILLPEGQDLPIICFRFERARNSTKLILTDKLGTPINAYTIHPDTSELKVEYHLRVQIALLFLMFKHDVIRTYHIPRYLDANGECVDPEDYQEDKHIDVFSKILTEHQSQSEHRIPFVSKTAEVVTVTI